MVAGNPGKTYGVGAAAYKMNVGPATSVIAKLNADGSVDVAGDTVFDPATDGLELQQADPTIDYAAGVGLPEEE